MYKEGVKIMGAADKTENEGFKLELLEYGYLAEDTDPTAEVFKVYVPKLQGKTQGGSGTKSERIDDSAFANSSDSELAGADSASSQEYIEVPVSPEIMIAHRHKFHDCPNNCINAVHTAHTCHSGISELKPCPHFHHDHHWPHVEEMGKIPKDSRVIVLFMNHDINNALVTRLECKFPSGGEPERPRDRR